ncbi:S-adenosyl-L-methionine-dependent methyltransferase [Ramaria rubella]|nr:S-adenosyl-L-methionine-dependent methyltransferase [Ramaria rubella]
MAHHNHPHTHGHSHSELAQANSDFFDSEEGATIQHSEDAKKVAVDSVKAILGVYEFDKENTTVLDFACGLGLVSKGLAPHAKSVVGVDISQRMVNDFNAQAAKAGLSDTLKAIHTDITNKDHELKGSQFDVIVCTLSYHHFPSPADTTASLSKLLKKGGSLIVIDWADPPKKTTINPSSGTEEAPKVPGDYVAHMTGMKKEDMEAFCKDAGMELTIFKEAYPFKFKDMSATCFIARGVKKE